MPLPIPDRDQTLATLGDVSERFGALIQAIVHAGSAEGPPG